jgi:hypothetical protein
MSNNKNNNEPICGEHTTIQIGTIIQLDDKIYKVKESVQIIDRICWHDGPQYIDGYIIQLVSLNKEYYETHSAEYLWAKAKIIEHNRVTE